MSKWTIYGKNGTAKHECIVEFNNDGKVVRSEAPEYSGKWMGERFVTVNVKSAYPIDFQIGDYIDYRGERFTINYDPSAIKKAKRGSYGEGFTYDSIKFNSYSNELTEIMFHDWVLSDNNLHYTSLPNFSFYCKDVDDLVDRLQANTDRWCKANGRSKEEYWMFYTLRNNTTTGTSDTGQTQTTYERTVQRADDILQSCGIESTSSEYTAFENTIKSNWKSAYGTGTSYKDSRDDERYDRTITASNQTVWDMMTAIKQQFGLNFIIKGRNVYVGRAGISTSHLFKYGKGNGLYEVDKTADQDQKVVTKLHAYGSSENMPTRYYVDLNTQYYALVTKIIDQDTTSNLPGAQFVTDLPWNTNYFNDFIEEGWNDGYYRVEVSCGGDPIVGYAWHYTENGESKVGITVRYAGSTANSQLLTYDKQAAANFAATVMVNAQVTFSKGLNAAAIPSDRKTYIIKNMPDNMAVNSLMLPGFPQVSLSEICRAEYDSDNDVTNYYIKQYSISSSGAVVVDSSSEVLFHTESGNHMLKFSTDRYDPYIVSPNAESLGIKEGDISCTEENDDNGLEKVYPTIEEMTVSDAGIGSGDTRLDAVVSADTIEDNGVYPNDKTDNIPGFSIVIPKLGFDLRQAAKDAGGSDMKISMKNGYCGGRTFDVSNCSQKSDGTWKLTCKRAYDQDLDLYFPYSYAAAVPDPSTEEADAWQILKGDNFVLTGIYVGDVNYVWAASVKLLRKAIHWLCKNDYTRYVFSPKIDEIFMAREQQSAEEGKSLHDTIQEGDILLFEDEDFKLNGAVYIDQLTIKENGNNGIPTYEVTLRDEIQVGTLQRIQNTVDSLKADLSNGSYSGGRGLSATDIDPLVKTYGSKYFLSKTIPDTAEGHITFNDGITVKNGIESDNIHNSGNITNEGDIKTKNLYVTGTAHFFELSIDKITASGGAHIYSAADGFSVDIVEYITDKSRVRLYWLAEDDSGKSIMNMWKALDQAICMSFNRATTGTSHLVSNKYYWALVTDVSGQETVEKTVDDVTHLYNWIELSTETYDGTLDPEVGDEIAMLGYRGTDDDARQSAIYDSAYSSLDTDLTPPFRAYYRYINDFDLKSHRYTYTDAHNMVLKGVTIQQLEDTNVRMEIDSSLGVLLDYGEVTILTCTIVDALWNDKTSEATSWKIERDTGDEVNDAAWQQKEKVVAFNALSGVSAATIDIAFTKDDCDIAEDTLLSTIFTISAYKTSSDGTAQVMAKRTISF